jgi:hypothetical protein
MDSHGQLALEYMLVIGFSLIILFPLTSALSEGNEINQAMTVARTGALQGAVLDGMAIYPEDAFRGYNLEHPRLICPSEVKILKIDYNNEGFNPIYQKTKIQIRVHASAPTIQNREDKDCLGDRINFYVRKSICETFNTQNLTNKVYNPAFSHRYVFTTGDVRWDG